MASDYWKKRIRAEQLAKMERGATLGEEMDRLYSYHFNELEKEIRAFEQRYADKNGLSLAEVKARVDDFDVKAFEEKAKRYVAEKNFSARANSELALYNLKMKTNRLALLQYQLDLELIALAEDERNLTERFLNDEFVKAIEVQSGLLGQSVLSASQIKTVAQSVLNTPFEGVVWSERIWQRQNALREVVARMTERLLLQGKNPTTMVAKLRKEFNVTASEAKRLAITEGARVSTEGQKQAYIANEIDEYEFIAEPSACPNCAKKDGKIFKVEDMIPGENAAPMHPWCHCSTGAYYSVDREAPNGVWNSQKSKTEMVKKQQNKKTDNFREILFEEHFPKRAEEKVFESFPFFNKSVVVLRRERLDHILEGHADIGKDVKGSVRKVIKNPDKILVDHKNKDSILVLGKGIENNINIAVRLSSDERDNSVITAMRVSDKTIKRILRKNTKIYDKEE
ncbi:minor capsid protein [Streptococcus suis]|nr:minor capsid protein [Streptococcus suis]